MTNGEIFNQADIMTVAHKKLPLGTKVLFVNKENFSFLVATARDRGPYIRGREFDLSKGAADYLGLRHRGVFKVHCLVLGK